VVAPLFKLQRKGVLFKMGADEIAVVETLKEALIKPPILITLDYSEGVGQIILTIYISLMGWGYVLV